MKQILTFAKQLSIVMKVCVLSLHLSWHTFVHFLLMWADVCGLYVMCNE